MSHICTLGVPKYQELNQRLEALRQALDSYNETGSLADKQTFVNRLAAATDQLTEYENWLLTPIQCRDQLLVTSDALVLEALDHNLKSLGQPDLDLHDKYNEIFDGYLCSLNFTDRRLPKDFDFSLLLFLSKLDYIEFSGARNLETLPRLPSSIEKIYAKDVNLVSFSGPLSDRVKSLDCSLNLGLQVLPELNEGLERLICFNCGLTRPPERLPISLQHWTVANNPAMRTLPGFSKNMQLIEVHASNIGLVDLPDDFSDTIPHNLEYLDLSENPLLSDKSKSMLRILRTRNIDVTFDE